MATAKKEPAKKAAPRKAAQDPTPNGEETVTTKAPTQAESLPDPNYDDGPGYFGETPDDTPNENYTVQGVVEGKPTPETDR